MKRFLILLLCGLLLASVPVAYAADGHDTGALLNTVISACLAEAEADSVQDWVDGDLTDGAGSRGEWYIIGLSQSGHNCDFTSYRKALEEYVESHEIRSAASRQRVALTFLAIGGGEDYVASVMADSLGQGLMSEVFGLHLMNNGVTHPAHSAESAIASILSMELPGGGWAIRGDVPEVDTTAMVLQALAHHREKEEVAAGIERALAVLSESQLPDGSYVSYGVANPESGAQIMAALCALDIHPLEDARFIKNGNTLLDGIMLFQLPDGGFSHELGGERNPTATLQVFYNLVALWRYEQGLPAFHIMDGPGEESAKGLQLPADYRFWVAGAAVLLGLGGCALLFAQGRRNRKNYVFVLVLAAAVAVGVQFVQLEKTENYYGQAAQLGADTISTTIAIRCDKVAGQRDYIPADGVVLPVTEMELNRGATAAEQLVAAARMHNIHIENEGGVSDYISGMAYLYEYDFGDLSGWVFCVNGEVAAVGCGEYVLSEGDSVEWVYSLEMGMDIQ